MLCAQAAAQGGGMPEAVAMRMKVNRERRWTSTLITV